MFGLPDPIRACLVDLDGVLRQTARVHAQAWKEMFDAYLRERAARTGEPFTPFEAADDYTRFVDGRPRLDGVRAFLASRAIELPAGDADDPPDAETISALDARKKRARARPDARARRRRVRGLGAIRAGARAEGMRSAVVSSSAGCREVLSAAASRTSSARASTAPSPSAATCAGSPRTTPSSPPRRRSASRRPRAAVFEYALAGVAAGRAGGFGWVVGVDRVGQADALRAHGADVVVEDVADLLERP